MGGTSVRETDKHTATGRNLCQRNRQTYSDWAEPLSGKQTNTQRLGGTSVRETYKHTVTGRNLCQRNRQTYSASVRKVACFSIFLNSKILFCGPFQVFTIKNDNLYLLTSILLLPMPLKTLAEHKNSQLVITGIGWMFQVPVYSSKLSKVHFTSMYSKMYQNFVLSVRRILFCELRSLNHFSHTVQCLKGTSVRETDKHTATGRNLCQTNRQTYSD